VFSQTASISGTIIDEQHGLFPGVNVTLLKEGSSVQSVQSDLDGKYLISNIETGKYNLKLTYIGTPEKIISIDIKKGINNHNFFYPEPCIPSEKICPKGHSDAIIPIAYGYPSKKTMRKAEKGKLKLGGCDNSPCERWNCKTHNIDFK
jgi:hypothetical protein